MLSLFLCHFLLLHLSEESNFSLLVGLGDTLVPVPDLAMELLKSQAGRFTVAVVFLSGMELEMPWCWYFLLWLKLSGLVPWCCQEAPEPSLRLPEGALSCCTALCPSRLNPEEQPTGCSRKTCVTRLKLPSWHCFHLCWAQPGAGLLPLSALALLFPVGLTLTHWSRNQNLFILKVLCCFQISLNHAEANWTH